MKDYFEIRADKLAKKDTLCLGGSIRKTIRRKWYNPFRWLMKETVRKRIDPIGFYIDYNPSEAGKKEQDTKG